MKERVQKILAEAGIASRRKAEEFIKQGRVKVNGQVIKLGDQADKSKDKIVFGGKEIKVGVKVYFVLNKPRGYICSVKDERGYKNVCGLIKTKEKIYPVGRLDVDTEGLLILTNDGELTNRITHPSYEIDKTYQAVLDRKLDDLKDLVIEGRKVQVKKVGIKGKEVTLTIHEGRKHIIKKIFEKLGRKVIFLKRIGIGGLQLKLKPGQYKKVTKNFLVEKVL